MREAQFAPLAERLLRGGIAPRHVRRTIFELQCHSNDLIGEFMARGCSIEESEAQAAARLGTEDALVESIFARSETPGTQELVSNIDLRGNRLFLIGAG